MLVVGFSLTVNLVFPLGVVIEFLLSSSGDEVNGIDIILLKYLVDGQS